MLKNEYGLGSEDAPWSILGPTLELLASLEIQSLLMLIDNVFISSGIINDNEWMFCLSRLFKYTVVKKKPELKIRQR